MIKIKIFALFDYLLLSASVFLMIIGIFFIFSSGINSENILVSNEYIKQIIWAITSLFIMFFAALIDYRKIKRWLKWIFPGLLALLIFTRKICKRCAKLAGYRQSWYSAVGIW